MTLEELARFDGREGRRAYVAVGGKVYDVTDSPLWAGGDHQKMHRAGADLTEALKRAPHVRGVMERFAVVAALDKTEPVPKRAGTRLLGAILILLALLAAAALLLRT